MKETIELSERLVKDAHAVGQISGRSVEDQIEFWIVLGRATEKALGSDRALTLIKRMGELE
ncbi:MAG: hypothetical protein QM715_09880 [Nibricoccus sp.]